jgi:hypothetical protein
MRWLRGFALNVGLIKPSYSCGRGSGLDFVASRLENAGRNDHPSPKFARRAGQGRADSATTLAPKVEKPATGQPRKAWGGKYDALTPAKPKEGKP